jgi:hypothetical protein
LCPADRPGAERHVCKTWFFLVLADEIGIASASPGRDECGARWAGGFLARFGGPPKSPQARPRPRSKQNPGGGGFAPAGHGLPGGFEGLSPHTPWVPMKLYFARFPHTQTPKNAGKTGGTEQ